MYRGRTKGGPDSWLQAVCDGRSRPRVLLRTEGQVSHHNGAALMFGAVPLAPVLPAERGYYADWFRQVPARDAPPPAFCHARPVRHFIRLD